MAKGSDSIRKIAPYINLGAIFASCLVLGMLFGHWLDTKLGTEPWLLLAGCLLGIVSGFYEFFKVVLRKGQTKDE